MRLGKGVRHEQAHKRSRTSKILGAARAVTSDALYAGRWSAISFLQTGRHGQQEWNVR